MRVHVCTIEYMVLFYGVIIDGGFKVEGAVAANGPATAGVHGGSAAL